MVSQLIQLSPLRPNAPLALALATFHTSLLVLLGVFLIYLIGDLGEALDGLNTIVGLLLFAYLWSINWITTAGALRSFSSLTEPPWWEVARGGLLWGGATGAAVIVILSTAVGVGSLVYGVGTADLDVVKGVYIYPFLGAAGGGPAFIVGAAFGFAFAAVDYVLLRLANLAAPPPASAPSTNGTSDV